MTSWATVWDAANGQKYSLAHRDLYPEIAIVDPQLALGAPRALTLATGLDALSHALESIWNVSANPVSANFAVEAARDVIETLPLLLDDLSNLELRSRQARAALMAGFAFSNTKTALAHNISYDITLKRGTPHGIACSFCLPAVMRWSIGADAQCDAESAPDLRRRPARRRGAAQGDDRKPRRLDRTRPITASNEPNGAASSTRAMQGERGKNFIGRLNLAA